MGVGDIFMKYTVRDFSLKILVFMAMLVMPAPVSAGMTLFNGTGDWQLGVLGNPDDGNATYRVCKNSKDRIKESNNEESLAILCITYPEERGEVYIGI